MKTDIQDNQHIREIDENEVKTESHSQDLNTGDCDNQLAQEKRKQDVQTEEEDSQSDEQEMQSKKLAN